MTSFEFFNRVQKYFFIFQISSATAFVLALIRLLNPDLFYLDPLEGNEIGNALGILYFRT